MSLYVPALANSNVNNSVVPASINSIDPKLVNRECMELGLGDKCEGYFLTDLEGELGRIKSVLATPTLISVDDLHRTAWYRGF